MGISLKRLVRSAVNPLRPCLRAAAVELLRWMQPDIQDVAARLHEKGSAALLSGIQSCGEGVTLGRDCRIASGRMLCLGNNVHIGSNALLDCRGGLTVGDHTRIGPNVVISTAHPNCEGRVLPFDDTFHLRPVWIGRHVTIGANVCVLPGNTIGDGAVIGAGVIVSEDVPPMAILEAPTARSTGHRNIAHYNALATAELHGDDRGVPIPREKLARFRKNARQKGAEVFFAASTGRSGSTSLADTLSQHPDITCLHEPRWNLIPLSTAYEHGTLSRDETEAALRRLYCESGWLPDAIYGESDLKLGNLIELLAPLLPEAKFVWLIRDGRDVVSSFVARRWYDPDLLQLPPNYHGPDERNYWDRHPLDGALSGHIEPAVWEKMTPFEKNCWYWQYWNQRIERQLAALPPDRSLFVRLEELQERVADLQAFVGVSPQALTVPRSNAVRSEDRARLRPWTRWTDEQHATFERWCGAGMDRWYPGWRGAAALTGSDIGREMNSVNP